MYHKIQLIVQHSVTATAGCTRLTFEAFAFCMKLGFFDKASFLKDCGHPLENSYCFLMCLTWYSAHLDVFQPGWLNSVWNLILKHFWDVNRMGRKRWRIWG